MSTARFKLLRLVRSADVHNRFRLYYPATEKGQPIYVHAKIMIIDDWLLRIGSSNLNNRSMAFDTECDLSLEVRPGMAGELAVRREISGLCHDLLAEHCGKNLADMAAAHKIRPLDHGARCHMRWASGGTGRDAAVSSRRI